MKIYRDKEEKFEPITIVIETGEEANRLVDIFTASGWHEAAQAVGELLK